MTCCFTGPRPTATAATQAFFESGRMARALHRRYVGPHRKRSINARHTVAEIVGTARLEAPPPARCARIRRHRHNLDAAGTSLLPSGDRSSARVPRRLGQRTGALYEAEKPSATLRLSPADASVRAAITSWPRCYGVPPLLRTPDGLRAQAAKGWCPRCRRP